MSLFRSFPIDYQMDSQDCGPSCLKMIAKYYGKYYSLQYLRDKCGITKKASLCSTLAQELRVLVYVRFR